MIQPLQISFRNMNPSVAVETRIREEVEKLESFYNLIMRCRVVVELPHKHQRKGDLYHVRIDMTVPGAEIVVKKKPSLHSTLRHVDTEKRSKRYEAQAAHKDVYVVIRDAFADARRQLQDYVRRVRRQVKAHVPKATARVSKLFNDQGYGFLETPEGSEIYFDRSSVLHGAFDRLAIGSPVTFSERKGEKGPQASTVRSIGWLWF